MKRIYIAALHKSFKKTLISIIFLQTLFLSVLSHADSCPEASFISFAEKLDNTKLESIDKLNSKFKIIATEVSPSCRMVIFSELRQYYYDFLNNYSHSININEKYDLASEEESRLRNYLQPYGLDLFTSEGYFYIGETGSYFLDNFSPLLTEDWKTYLEKRKQEVNEKFSEDAGLLISWDVLRKRIVFWENFSDKYKDFPEAKSIKSYLDIYIRTYLTGMSNSPIYDYESSAITIDVIKSYESFINENSASKYYKIVYGQYKILKMHNFVLTQKASDDLLRYHKENGIKTMVAVQPPIY